MRGFIEELRRRNLFRVAIGYVAIAWLVIQVLETLFPIFGLPEARIRWIVIVLAIGFVPALAFAWIFEWTPRGLARESEVDHDDPALLARSNRFDRAVIAVLALAVLYFAVDEFVIEPAPPTPERRAVAVLPFTDLTPGGDQAWFADGIADEILNLVVRSPSLQVASRTSAFSFRDAALPVDEIARRLNVDYVLEGSVRRAGDRVRIAARLTSAEDGFQLWSETYDRQLDDVFAIQDDIAAHIARTLEGSLSGDFRPSPVADGEAYALYLQANYLARQGSEDAMRRALALYLDAVDVDADYPPAWSELAALYVNLAANGYMDYDEGYRLGREAALTAAGLDPSHAPAYDQLAWIAFWYDGDIGLAATHIERALEIAPQDADILGTAAVFVTALGDLEEAVELHEYSVARSPVEPLAYYNLGLAYKYAGRLADAERSFRKTLQLSPDYAGARYQLGETLLLAGRPDEALAAWQDETDDAYRTKGEALAYHDLGDSAAAETALGALIDGWGDRWPSEVAHVYAWRGELDAAFDWLDREYEAYGAGGWGEWRHQPLYDNLRDDPRWQAFLERVGASPAQLGGIALDVAIPD